MILACEDCKYCSDLGGDCCFSMREEFCPFERIVKREEDRKEVREFINTLRELIAPYKEEWSTDDDPYYDNFVSLQPILFIIEELEEKLDEDMYEKCLKYTEGNGCVDI